jgi:hypothetical protein
MGVDTSRILDVCFPGPSVLGLLVHAQYVPEVEKVLAAAKVSPVSGFDPLDPANIADPEYRSLPASDRAQMALELQFRRCVRALERFNKRPHLLRAIGRSFVSSGWMEEAVVEELLLESLSGSASGSGLSSGAPVTAAGTAGDPGAAFRDDTEMDDVSVVCSRRGSDASSL